MYPLSPLVARPLRMSHHCNSPSIDLECPLTYSTIASSPATASEFWTNPQFRYKYQKIIDQHHAITNYLCMRTQMHSTNKLQLQMATYICRENRVFQFDAQVFFCMEQWLPLSSPRCASCTTTWQLVMYLYSSMISCNARERANFNYFWRQ